VTPKIVTKCHDHTTTKITNDSALISSKVKVLSESSSGQSNPSYNRTYFRNKAFLIYTLREFSSEDFDYYGIINETLCSLYKLDHDNEEGIEGRYEAESYFITSLKKLLYIIFLVGPVDF
jgi:hypothetical protein